MSAAGRFITLEGGEGAGKSTQCRRLAEALEAAGHAVVQTREPGGSPGAETIRELIVTGAADRWDAVTETLLILAARRDHVERTIRPALARGAWVVCDRFADSTAAYQGAGHGLGREWVVSLGRQALGDFEPDLTVVLDTPPDQGLKRAAARGGADRFERLDGGFHERMHAAFRAIVGEAPGRCCLVDGTGGVDDVAASVQAAVAARLPESGLGGGA